jgi:hypothetical protein
MTKKLWRKPELKQIEAGAAEKALATTTNDGAANKS